MADKEDRSTKGATPPYPGGDRESPEDSSPAPDTVDYRPAPTLADQGRENPSTHPGNREALDEASEVMEHDTPEETGPEA